MIPAIMKIGTLNSGAYYIKTNKPLLEYKVGQKIKFRPQLLHGAKWEEGIITGWSREMPLIERI